MYGKTVFEMRNRNAGFGKVLPEVRSTGCFLSFTISVSIIITGSDARTRCFESRPEGIETVIGILDTG